MLRRRCQGVVCDVGIENAEPVGVAADAVPSELTVLPFDVPCSLSLRPPCERKRGMRERKEAKALTKHLLMRSPADRTLWRSTVMTASVAVEAASAVAATMLAVRGAQVEATAPAAGKRPCSRA